MGTVPGGDRRATAPFLVAAAHYAAILVRVAAIYDAWFDGRECPRPPSTWTRVGTWRIADNVACGNDVATFYAVDAESAAALRMRLVAFAPSLPSGVTQTLQGTVPASGAVPVVSSESHQAAHAARFGV